jgi:predicted ATPase
VRLTLKPLSVMIGANGTGKTSVLDVLSLLASSAQGKLSSSISELSGLANVLTYDRATEVRLGITMEVPGHEPLKYSFGLRSQGVGYVISDETLLQRQFGYINSMAGDPKYYDTGRKTYLSPTWEHNALETSLAQVPRMFKEQEDFRRRLASSTFYQVLNVDPRSPVRLPQAMGPPELPGRNGEDLISCLFYLRETTRYRFDAIEDSLRAAFPRFDRLDFPPSCGGHAGARVA